MISLETVNSAVDAFFALPEHRHLALSVPSQLGTASINQEAAAAAVEGKALASQGEQP